jgi:hypothetical protein
MLAATTASAIAPAESKSREDHSDAPCSPTSTLKRRVSGHGQGPRSKSPTRKSSRSRSRSRSPRRHTKFDAESQQPVPAAGDGKVIDDKAKSGAGTAYPNDSTPWRTKKTKAPAQQPPAAAAAATPVAAAAAGPAESQKSSNEGFFGDLVKACDKYDEGYEEGTQDSTLKFPIVLEADGTLADDDVSGLCFYDGCHGRHLAGIPELVEFFETESIRYRTGMIDHKHYVKIAHSRDGPINSAATELVVRFHNAKKWHKDVPPIRGTVVFFPFKGFEALFPL